jgi:predicted histidine transporter YuiF (NhaC family)
VSEKELGKALLNLDAAALAGTPDVRQQTWAILERDRRRVRLLTGVTVATWVLAVLMVFGVLVAFGFLFPEEAKLRMEIEAGNVTAAQREQLRDAHFFAFQKGTLIVIFAVVLLALAALCTLLLVLASRRATLRQINASLVEISDQLKQMRQALGK